MPLAEQFRRQFRTAYAVKDQWGNIGKKFNNLAAAMKWARINASREGITLSIWSGKGFTVSLGIRFNRGSRRGR